MDFEKDAEVVEPITGEKLKRLTGLSQDLLDLRDQKEALEDDLDELSKKEFKLSSMTIPQYMEEIGMKEFKLQNGEKIEIKEMIKVSLNKENKAMAYKFIEDVGAGDIIKHNIAVSFGKSQDEEAKKALKLLKKGGFEPSDELNVHGSTLKAWVGRYMEDDSEDKLPLDLVLFGVYEYSLTKITQPKKKKGFL